MQIEAPPAISNAAAPYNQPTAVIGSMMVRTSVTLFAGKPLRRACSCTVHLADARQVTFDHIAFHGSHSVLVLTERNMATFAYTGQMTFLTM
jgi:hypothetical protein